MMNRNNTCFKKILPFLKGFNWLCKKGVVLYLVGCFVTLLLKNTPFFVSYQYVSSKLYGEQKACLENDVWIPHMFFVMGLGIWAVLLFLTGRKTSWWGVLLCLALEMGLEYWHETFLEEIVSLGCRGVGLF